MTDFTEKKKNDACIIVPVFTNYASFVMKLSIWSKFQELSQLGVFYQELYNACCANTT